MRGVAARRAVVALGTVAVGAAVGRAARFVERTWRLERAGSVVVSGRTVDEDRTGTGAGTTGATVAGVTVAPDCGSVCGATGFEIAGCATAGLSAPAKEWAAVPDHAAVSATPPRSPAAVIWLTRRRRRSRVRVRASVMTTLSSVVVGAVRGSGQVLAKPVASRGVVSRNVVGFELTRSSRPPSASAIVRASARPTPVRAAVDT